MAWLQLEEADADPARFWVSVTAAIGRAAPAIAERLEPLVAGSLGAGQVVVPALVNELAARRERLVVVLDDYHLVDDADVHRGVERLLDLCPPQLTVVLITRADPPFRLGRMRVRGRVREIRAGDLRFDAPEASALLGATAEGLGSERLDELCARTEGWAAGLVLAGLSLARTDDADRFVRTFRGDDQLVAGYLTDELLAVLDPDERRRMVEAAVLHRLTGPAARCRHRVRRRRPLARSPRRPQPARDPARRRGRVVPLPPPVPRPAPARGATVDARAAARPAPAGRRLVRGGRHTAAQARAVVQGAAGSHFLPDLVAAFERLSSAAPAPAPNERELTAADLAPGMVMAQDLLSPQGTLLLAAGFVFDAPVISTIRDLLAREGLDVCFRIRDTRRQAVAA